MAPKELVPLLAVFQAHLVSRAVLHRLLGSPGSPGGLASTGNSISSRPPPTLCAGPAINLKDTILFHPRVEPIIFQNVSRSVMSDSLRPRAHGLLSTRLLCPWNFPDQNTGVGCHALLQGIFLTQGSNPGLLYSLPSGKTEETENSGICPWARVAKGIEGDWRPGRQK